MLRRSARTAIASIVGLAVTFGVLVPSANADTLVSLPLQVDFQDAASTPAAGYVADSGAAYDTNRGYGWVDQSTGAPLSIVGNGRDRNVVADARLDTFLHMQLPAGAVGVTTPAAWKANVPNGAYSITVAAGDPSYTDSRHVVRVEGLSLLDFTPTSAATAQQTNTATINVADGVLNVDAVGGTNTKISYITVTPTTSSTPTIISVDPNNGSTGNFRDVAITVRTSNGVGAGTANANSFKLLDSNNNPVAGFYNVDGAYSNASFKSSSLLAANATYQVQVNSNLKDSQGNSYAPFTSTFTTGTAVSTQQADVSFTTSTFDSSSATPGPMAIAKGPDGKLYVAYNNGSIVAYTLDANGNKTGSNEITTFKLGRTITGLTFDPASTANDLKLYVTNNQYGCDLSALGIACSDFTGKISRLTGTSSTNLVAQDVITGLPRSVGDHMTNGTAFGPDGALYIAQGAQNGYGATDVTWGQRAEVGLSAAVLRADVRTITTAVNVNTSAPTSYNPKAAGAKVTLYVTGIRNPYSLVWGSNGKLYAPVNESSNGNTPADPAGGAGALNNLPSFNDYFTEVVAGKYYGHPNPARGEYRLNGGNPTAGVDAFEVPQYPVGTQPNANYRTPDLDLGNHRSANGAAQFTSNVFGSNLQGQILVTEYVTKDIIAIKLDANGKAVSKTVVAAGFNNPLPIYIDNASGRVYVGEYGSDPKGEGGKVTLLKPNGTTPTDPNPPTGTSWKVDFTKEGGAAAVGYSADFGQAYDAARGYGWNKSLVGNGRERTSGTDTRMKSFIHMQLPNNGASGVLGDGTWELAVPNGTYNLTIGVGDSDNTDSVNVLRAEGTQIVNYTSTVAAPQTTTTATVVVADGKLTLDPTGGTNTKLAYLDVVQATTTPTDPNPPNPGATTLKVDFTTQTGTVAAGYTRDYGLAYNNTAGFGWLGLDNNTPTSMVGNARERNVVADKRMDTFTHLQLGQSSDGIKTVGKWEAALVNGTYNVTVGVGDPSYTDSTHVIRAEGVKILEHAGTAAVPQKTVTASVIVSDGKLTLDPTGGTNTKLAYVDIVPAGTTPPAQADTTAPTVAINTTGSTNTSGAYLGAATVTIVASDASGIDSTTYTVASASGTSAPQPYTGAFQITGAGTYTIAATSKDKATPTANSGSANKVITIAALPGGGNSGTLAVTTPEDNLGLGSRLVFSTVKNEARTGHSATLKNTGSNTLTVSNLAFSGTNAAEFQLCTGQAASFTIAPNATKEVCVQYRPNRAFTGITTNLSSANLAVTHSGSTSAYVISLGGLSTSNYEGDDEASLQDIFTALGYKTNAGLTNLPYAKSVGVTSTALGDEVLSPYFLRNDATKPVSLIPTAHYSGKDYSTDWRMGWFAKGNNNLNNLYAFNVGSANNGYGENQNLLSKVNAGITFNPSGAFGIGDSYGNRSDDAKVPDGQFHNYRFYPAKNAAGAVIPNTYLVGVDIGSPLRNSAKNWDYQDFAFVLTNVKLEGTAQPAAGAVNANYEFDGTNRGFTTFQNPSLVTAGDISVANGKLTVKSSNDSNTSHRNALMTPTHIGSYVTIEARLVGPFTSINAGEEQQAIWFGPDATHYLKLEIENSGNANTKKITLWQQNGTTGQIIAQTTVNATGLNTIDFKFDIDPRQDGGPKLWTSYKLNTGAYTALSSNYLIPNTYVTQATGAGIMQSHQGGGTQFSAVYEWFKIVR